MKRSRRRFGPRDARKVVLTLTAVAAVAFVAWLRPDALRRSRAPVADSLGSLDAKRAYLRGVELVRGDRSTAALPYFRSALKQRPDLWQVHADYATALLNSVVEVVPRRGIPTPALRSSRVRFARVNEAFERFASAERLAPSARDRAFVLRQRAAGLTAWGLAWDAREDEQRAALDDPDRLGPAGQH